MKRIGFVKWIVLAALLVTLTATLVLAACTPEEPVPPALKKITGVTFNNKEIDYNGQEQELTVTGTIPEGVTVVYTNNKGKDVGVYNATAVLSGEGYETLTLTATLTIKGKQITGITFKDKTVTYNKQQHTVEIDGDKPNDVQVTYSNNTGTDAGTYNATAVLSGDGYETLTLTATLTIEQATIEGMSLQSETVEYDGQEHSLVLTGNLPDGVTSVVWSYNDEERTSVIAPGKYVVTVTLSGKNYKELTLSATLNITSTEEMLYAINFNGRVFFQNSLDGNAMYAVTSSGNPQKIGNDVPQYFCVANDKLYYYSASLLTQTIRQLTLSGDKATINTKYNPGRATYLASDGTNLYYAKTNLIDVNKENGIYKTNVSGANATDAVRICTAKASDLAYYNGYIYFINKDDGDKLYKVSVTESDSAGTLVHDKKISDLIVDEEGYAFFTQYDTQLGVNVAAAIHKLNLSTDTLTKLTTDKGKYLTKMGEYIYYINADLLTSNIFGKGIYRVSINASGNLTSEKLLDSGEDDGFYSLTGDGTNLYYYNRSEKHFYRFNPETKSNQDLMRNFVVPQEEPTFALYPYSFVTEHDGEIYYANPLESGMLYKYNPTTKINVRVLSDSVSNVYFHENYMYYNTYIATNYALWRLDLTQSEAEPQKISPHRYENLIFQGNYLYATRIAVALSYDNHIVRFDLDNLQEEEVQIYNNKNVNITKLFLVNNVFYFGINPFSGTECIYTHDLDGALEQNTDTGLVSNNFVIVGNKFYYYNHKKNTFNSANIDGTSTAEITSDVEITNIVVADGVVYYTSVSKNNTGIYSYNTATGRTTKLTDKVGNGLTVYEGKLYFINLSITWLTDYPQKGDGDGHLYCVSIAGGTAEKIA